MPHVTERLRGSGTARSRRSNDAKNMSVFISCFWRCLCGLIRASFSYTVTRWSLLVPGLRTDPQWQVGSFCQQLQRLLLITWP